MCNSLWILELCVPSNGKSAYLHWISHLLLCTLRVVLQQVFVSPNIEHWILNLKWLLRLIPCSVSLGIYCLANVRKTIQRKADHGLFNHDRRSVRTSVSASVRASLVTVLVIPRSRTIPDYYYSTGDTQDVFSYDYTYCGTVYDAVTNPGRGWCLWPQYGRCRTDGSFSLTSLFSPSTPTAWG